MLGNKSSILISFLETKVPENEGSRERKFLETIVPRNNVPPMELLFPGITVLGYESSMKH